MKAKFKIGMSVLLALAAISVAAAQDDDWPRTVALDQGTVTVYEPQVDEMNDDFIRFRAALAYRENPGDEPVFGAGWFESDLQVDRLSRTAHPVGMKVTQTRFPVEADVQTSLSNAMAMPSFASNFTFSLDELEQSAKITQAEAKAAEKLNTTPPKIIYRDQPALLVNIDGEPVLREVENTPFEAVINTPYPLIREGKDFYLNVAQDVWYRSASATGPFHFTDSIPSALKDLVRQEDNEVGAEDDSSNSLPTEKVTAANAPEIVVSTEPAELIVTEGPAAFVPLVDNLLVLNNSDDDVFMHLDEQNYYIVLAGRWYRSASLDGPWVYRDADALPAAFAEIPESSAQADSRVYVAGTEESKEAVLDAQVPQTATVKRGQAEVEVQYDGAPVFEGVEGTDMVYIANTGSTVLLADGLYYLVEDGVWYVSANHEGPWQVALERPDQVQTILPSSPVYNVKYVHVYDYTPEVVYVGYTPGYLGSYVYHSTVFYGSGWYYRPWVSANWYYPHHRTWGFHVSYDPWYGWNYGLSWAWGPFSFSYWPGGYWHHSHHWHHRHYSYWGPHGYRPRHHHHRRHHRNPDYYEPRGRHRQPGHGGGDRPHPYERHHNLYADSGQQARVAGTRDKEPRGLDIPRRDDSFAGKAYAKNGFDKGQLSRQSQKQKIAYAAAKPVSRTDLASKAGNLNAGFNSRSKKPTAVSGKAYSKTVDPPRKTLTRTDLASKAKSGEQRFKASNEPFGSKSAGKSLKPGSSKVSRTDLARLKVKDSRSKSQPVSPGKTSSTSPTAKQAFRTPSSKPVGKSYSKTPVKKPTTSTVKSYANTRPKSTVPSSGSKARTYSKSKSMPTVKLTRPVQKPSYSQSRPKVSTPATRPPPKPQPQKQYSKASVPKQSRPASPPQQKKSEPVRNKQKSQRVK
jgi:hypothetical protein